MLLFADAAKAADAWWAAEWSYRRPVTVASAKPTGLAGDDVAVLEMSTGGQIKPDGSDIRVTTAAGQERPCRVLMVGPGDQVKLAFALAPDQTKYYVYFGNAKAAAPAPAQKLQLQRGVLMETWAYTGGAFKTIEQVQAIFDKPGALQGRGFRPNIFQGFNPFGPANRIASRYTGYLNCTKEGSYEFAVTGSDSSFLLIDDKVVVDFGGMHEPTPEVRASGSITLKPGLHKLVYYHVTAKGEPMCVAAWRPPGGGRIWTIPAEAFAPVTVATADAAQWQGHTFTVDFDPVHEGEAFVANRYYQRYSFKARVSGTRPAGLQLQWDFGDGQTASAESAQHVYLVNGEYTVTLSARNMPEMTWRSKVFVSRPWERVTGNELDSVKDQAQIVSGYDFEKLPDQMLAEALLLMHQVRSTTAVVAAGDALLKRPKLPAPLLEDVMGPYTQALVDKGQGAKAVEQLLAAAKDSTSVTLKATAMTEAGLRLLELGTAADLDRAAGLFAQVIEKYEPVTTISAIRRARIGIGDVWRARLDYAKAREAYDAAKPRRENIEISDAVLRGDMARHVEEFIRRGDWGAADDGLQEWAATFPADKLDGYWSLLTIKWCMGQQRWPQAANEAAMLVGVNPLSNYAAQILMLQSQAYAKMGKADQAKAALQQVVDKYKESPLAADAAKQLGITTQPSK